jgi:hypothetical protein
MINIDENEKTEKHICIKMMCDLTTTRAFNLILFNILFIYII